MKKVYSNIIQFFGNHYDFGYMQGELLKDSPILMNRKKQWGSDKRNFLIDEKEVIQTFMRFAPRILDEIQGLADSLKMNPSQALKEFGGYYKEYGRSGCSIFTTGDVMIRNYDNDPSSYEGRYVLFQPDHGYATIGPTMQITGRTDGMNEHGLALGYNFVHRKKSQNGFVCNMIGRIVLETCRNVQDAIDLLKELPHRHSFNYVLLDATSESIVVEASPRKVTTRRGNMCTNHFELLTDENRYRMDDSISRISAIQQQEKDVTTPYEAFRLLNDTDKSIFSKKYGAWAGTLHTAAYLPKEGKAWIALGGDRLPVIFDFDQWLKGEKSPITKLKGELDTSSPFVNMELL